MASVLEVLIQASEKAASVARSCCFGENELLVAEKCEGEANLRFDKDFKTIADVLAQESAKTEIAIHFPELANYVRGEECSEMGGVRITLQADTNKTTELLRSLVPLEAAKRMAAAAHTEVQVNINDFPKSLPPINTDDLGVWIDPIDATAEFIAGVRGQSDANRGLPCVTVLIGAYLRSTGEPVMGVINQPFYNGMKGRITWGIHYGDLKAWGCSDMKSNMDTKIVLMSGAEKSEIRDKVKQSGWEVKSVPGAGHKLMKVVLGEAAAYIVSQGTTFRWDTCAPHAILKAKGGDIVCYIDGSPIKYNVQENMNTQVYCNSSGLIAYSDKIIFEQINKVLAA